MKADEGTRNLKVNWSRGENTVTTHAKQFSHEKQKEEFNDKIQMTSKFRVYTKTGKMDAKASTILVIDDITQK